MSPEERRLMLLITGLTNFASFPALYLLFQKGLYFQFHMGVFTFFTSFMYHSLESVEINMLYIDRGTWHKLDNIGSIMCFIMLWVYWMDNLQYKEGEYHSKHVTSTDLHLNMTGLFVTMLMQANHPWKLENTIVPIVIFFLVFLVKVTVIRKPRFNLNFFTKGTGLLSIAVVFFYRGLDEDNDYLRVNHGLWHSFAGLSSFYLWQSIDKDRTEGFQIAKCQSQARYELFDVLKSLFSFKFIKKKEVKSF